jgi:hypothetical protein
MWILDKSRNWMERLVSKLVLDYDRLLFICM